MVGKELARSSCNASAEERNALALTFRAGVESIDRAVVCRAAAGGEALIPVMASYIFPWVRLRYGCPRRIS